MINTTQPHLDFIQQFWTGSGDTGGPFTDYIWVDSATQVIPGDGTVIHTFFLSSSSATGNSYNVSFDAPTTSEFGRTLTPAEYDILSGSMFVFYGGINILTWDS